MAVVRTYHCPACRNSISPTIALVVRPFVQCSRCPTRVYVSRDMVIDNWRRNVYLQCVLAVWLGLTIHFATAPPRPGQTHSPAGAVVGMLLVGWLPAFICALPVIPIGYVLGHVVACFVAKGPPQPDYTLRYPCGSGHVPEDHAWR
jgi:hypothetical protein